MKINVSLIVVLVLATILGGCDLFEKGEPKTELEKLPRATQSGKNTFGCLVGGKAWVPQTSVDAYGFYQEGILSLTAILETARRDQGMSFVIYDSDLSESTYQLGEEINPSGYYANFGDNIQECGFATTVTHTGKLVITHLDETNFIISGTFEFEAYSDDCSKTVQVTDGRFDLHYAP